MPGEKLPRCPKGEHRDKKSKLCVKKTKKESPKKSPKNTTKKAIPKNSPKNTTNVSSKKKTPSPKSNKSSKKRSKSPSPTLPLLSKMTDLSDWNKKYMRSVLYKLANLTSYKGYLNDGHPYHYVRLISIIGLLNKEIENIKIHHKSGSFTFSDESEEVILPQLKNYIVYFKHIADKEKNVDIDIINDLYD